MKTRFALILALGLVLAACGGGDGTNAGGSDDQTTVAGSNDGGGASGDVVDLQPAGRAYVSVDGQEFNFDTPGLTDCNVESETFTFSYIIGDNEVGLAGGANLYDDGWLGDITVRVVGDDGLPIQFFPEPGGLDDGIAIDGDSISYSGPMLKRPPNDGSNPPDEAVGNGVISVTCG